MGLYLVELWLDGYDTDEARQKAELEFIREQLDMSASHVTARPFDTNELVG